MLTRAWCEKWWAGSSSLGPISRSISSSTSTSTSTSTSLRPTPSSLRTLQLSYSSVPRRTFAVTSSMASTRTESDAFGEIQVQSDKYWGAQTERSLENFKINQPQDRMPPPIVRAFGILKGAAAKVNVKYGLGRYCTPMVLILI